jgi:NADPH:quinone reductase-like Zn-dependent oxidoreductase
MKAILYTRPGPPEVLRYEEIPKPTPADDEVLLRIRAASVNPLDWRLLQGGPFLVRLLLGMRKQKVTRPGREVAGEVEAVGRNVVQLKVGDAVFGTCEGAFAEYACAAESQLALKPENVTFEQAAAVPVAAFTALQGLRDRGQVKAGEKVLINGAAGGVGTFAVQIAKAFGAEVTGVCSTRNVELVRSLGADHVIDYTREDFTQGGERYDVIFDAVGNHSLSACRRVLNPKGLFLMVGGPKELGSALTRALKAVLLSPFVSQSFVVVMARRRKEDLIAMSDLIAAGKVTPVIDRTYPLREVAKAFRYMEAGHARGKVVITV